MKVRTMFECEFCHKRYDKKKEALECEAHCLGLTNDEYSEYTNLLKEEAKAYDFVSHTNNKYTRQKCDDATNAVIEFQNRHGIANDAKIRLYGCMY